MFWKSDVTVIYPDDSVEVRHAAVNESSHESAELVVEKMVDMLGARIVDIDIHPIVPGSDDDHYIDVSKLRW